MGHVPVFADENEWLEWSEKVHEARHVGLEPYNPPHGGPLISYGFKKYSGYIEVGVNKETPDKVNDSSLNEIYQTIAEHFEEAGISDIPVVFVWDLPAQTEEALLEEIPPTEEESSSSMDTLENKNAQDEEDSTQTTPSFTSVMLVMCLLVLAKVKLK